MMKLLLLDIDNTLLIPRNIFIYYNNGRMKKKYTPEEYALIEVDRSNKKYFDYSDFRNPDVIRKSINSSKPIETNLSLIRDKIKNGWSIGILTARGEQDIIKPLMKKWLDENLKLNIKIPYIDSEFYGVNDKKYNYPGCSDADKKFNVVKKIHDKKIYEKMAVIDDSIFILNLIEEYNNVLEEHEKIITYVAKK